MLSKIPAGLLSFAVVVTMSATVSGQVEARAGPKIVPTEAVSPTASPTATSAPTQTPTPFPTPTPTQMPTPTPTLEPHIEITADYKVKRCLRYLDIVHQWLDLEPSEFEHLDDPILVMAVAVAESGCDNTLLSSAGARGIMQVIPKPWTADAEFLKVPRVNIYWGMWILDRSMNLAYGRGEGLEYALAYYNCSFDKVQNDLCGPKGGLHYADDVLNFWKPYIETYLEELE